MEHRSLFERDTAIVPVRALHLDLKGCQPTPRRLVDLLKVVQAARYNAVLVEWEDTFPWNVDERFRSETFYKPEEVRQFHAAANELGIQIIPLVQCLGHMETFLRPAGYEHLREVPHKCNVLNPLASGGRQLVETLVDDVLTLTPKPQYFHLGGDEAWTFGTHPDTKAFIEKHGKGALYLRHVEPILDKLNARGIRPILWHDMMREWNDESLRAIGEKADLMVWGYKGHPDTTNGPHKREHIERLVAQQIPLWGATAYKGGDGDDRDLPDLENRRINALAWSEVAQRYGLKGLAATAWSRYSTHQAQNEPIDGALNAMLIVGVILHDGQAPQDQNLVLSTLEEIGERARFESCRAALVRLAEWRQHCWRMIQMDRQQIVTQTMDSRRRGSGLEVEMFRHLRAGCDKAPAVADQVGQALAGLMPDLWIERYLAERIEPIGEEVALIESRVRQVNPIGYAAQFGD